MLLHSRQFNQNWVLEGITVPMCFRLQVRNNWRMWQRRNFSIFLIKISQEMLNKALLWLILSKAEFRWKKSESLNYRKMIVNILNVEKFYGLEFEKPLMNLNIYFATRFRLSIRVSAIGSHSFQPRTMKFRIQPLLRCANVLGHLRSASTASEVKWGHYQFQHSKSNGRRDFSGLDHLYSSATSI